MGLNLTTITSAAEHVPDLPPALNCVKLRQMTNAELRRLARIVAEARLEALEREIAAIYAVFPELRTGRSAPNEGVREALKRAVTRRRRPRLSPKARKRIAEAQRKRWTELKAKQSNTSTVHDTAATSATAMKAARKKK